MEYDFSKIELLPQQIRFLKKLQHRRALSPGSLDVSDLFDSNLIQPSERCRMSKALREVEINKKGRLFLQWRWEDRFRHRWPVYLAVAALIISIASFIQALFF